VSAFPSPNLVFLNHHGLNRSLVLMINFADKAKNPSFSIAKSVSIYSLVSINLVLASAHRFLSWGLSRS